MKKVGYLASNNGTIPFTAKADGRYFMRNSGENTGNLAFWYAVRNMFQNPIKLIEWNGKPSDYYDVDVVVIPAANHLNPQWDLQRIADLVTGIDKECIVMGLGAQAQHEGEKVILTAGTINYLKAVSERARTLFVRGVFTADVCAGYGVTNVTPLGCPSITISSDCDLGRMIESRIGQPCHRIYGGGAAFKNENADLERHLFAMICLNQGSTYLIQCPETLIDLAEGRAVDETDPVVQKAHRILAPDQTFSSFTKTFHGVTSYFGNVPGWLEAARRHDYAISTRIHGGILSLMAGVPTIVAGHDTRIRELCGSMNISCLPPRQIETKLRTVLSLFDEVKFDGAAFDARRRAISKIYQDYLLGSGLLISDHLKFLSASAS